MQIKACGLLCWLLRTLDKQLTIEFVPHLGLANSDAVLNNCKWEMTVWQNYGFVQEYMPILVISKLEEVLIKIKSLFP